MEEIKNWQKTGNCIWTNDKLKIRVGIDRELPSPYGNGYIAFIQKAGFPPSTLYSVNKGNTFAKKSDAIDALKKWMNSNIGDVE